ncbi:MAG: hydrogenase maturation nickel metallochaperone HypA [bacterium]
MHELSIAQSILDIVLEKAEENNAERVLGVECAFGEKTGIIKDSMQFIWEIITADTIADKSQLHITIIDLEAECRQCGKRFVVTSLYDPCPHCQNDSITILQGLDEMKVLSLDIDEENYT